MKSLVNLLSALLADAGSICSVETARDLITIKSRTQHEGISFLTITLPEFASDFERGLELGRIDSTLFLGWRKRGCLPAFLQGFTSLVFGPDGRVRDEANASAVFCVRQICRIFKKVRIPCSSERESATFRKYHDLEASLSDTLCVPDDRLHHFRGVCRIIWDTVFGREEFNSSRLVPRHGPGATAERISGNAKYAHHVWYERLSDVFHFDEYIFSSLSQFDDPLYGYNSVKFIEEHQELPVRVISVPKTLKGPRIIAIEPVCMQYVQQAVGRYVMDSIEGSTLTRKSIRFTDQSVNQQLAMQSSLQKDLATLDLSDASDRVLLDSVRHMLHSQPNLLAAVEACRSRTAQTPDGKVISLKKFASMGSALCFPIESMYFYSVIVHTLLWERKLTPHIADIRKMSAMVHVYGDDIIVPVHETDSVIEGLTLFGNKVNTTKSFWNGSFRESCGCDAFNGIDVTPVYVREMRPKTRRDSAGLISWVSTSNQLHAAGCWRSAQLMKHEVERVLGSLPVVGSESPGLGWTSFLGVPTRVMCRHMHIPLVKTHKVITRRERDALEGYPALLKYFLRTEKAVRPIPISKEHLQFSVRNGSVSRKRHWVRAI